jgi:hypothetical protein
VDADTAVFIHFIHVIEEHSQLLSTQRHLWRSYTLVSSLFEEADADPRELATSASTLLVPA